MEVDKTVILRLLTALRDCSRHVARGVAEHPLDELDVGLLTLAEAAGGTLRPSQAAEALEIGFPSVTRHVRALQAAGQLAVDPDAADRRSYRIVLTADGKALLEEFQQGLITRFAPVVAGWEPADLEQLADGLTRLAAAMTTARQATTPHPSQSPWWRAQIQPIGNQP